MRWQQEPGFSTNSRSPSCFKQTSPSLGQWLANGWPMVGPSGSQTSKHVSPALIHRIEEQIIFEMCRNFQQKSWVYGGLMVGWWWVYGWENVGLWSRKLRWSDGNDRDDPVVAPTQVLHTTAVFGLGCVARICSECCWTFGAPSGIFCVGVWSFHHWDRGLLVGHGVNLGSLLELVVTFV